MLSDPQKRYDYDHPEEKKQKYNFRDEHTLFKDFYKRGTFDENTGFKNFKDRWFENDKFYRNVPSTENID